MSTVNKLAHTLSEQQVREARVAFDKHDKDRSGTIDYNELKPLLEETLKQKLSENLFNRYVSAQFSSTDKNQDNAIQFDEFLVLYDKLYHSKELPISLQRNSSSPKMVTSKVESPSTNSPKVEKRADKLSEEDRRNARQMFDKYDKDKSGNISKDELRSLLEEYLRTKKMGNMVFERLVNGYMQQADKDGSGDVDFEEFLSIYSQIAEASNK